LVLEKNACSVVGTYVHLLALRRIQLKYVVSLHIYSSKFLLFRFFFCRRVPLYSFRVFFFNSVTFFLWLEIEKGGGGRHYRSSQLSDVEMSENSLLIFIFYQKYFCLCVRDLKMKTGNLLYL
jgi:hypothetical protein